MKNYKQSPIFYMGGKYRLINKGLIMQAMARVMQRQKKFIYVIIEREKRRIKQNEEVKVIKLIQWHWGI